MELFKSDIVLGNAKVLLQALSHADTEALAAIAFDSSIWTFTVSALTNEAELQQYIDKAILDRTQETRYAFRIIDKESGRIAGSTSIGNVSQKDARLEIGWTWLGKAFQGKNINTNVKFLLLEYVFENLAFERVEFKTDARNIQSRKALCKMGAVEEGILRQHTLMHDGLKRDTVYYSILRSEWEAVKQQFQKKVYE